MTETPQIPTLYLDLDAVVPEREVVLKLDGNQHKLATITLEDFVKNNALIQSLQGKDMEAEVNGLVDMLDRSFPSVTRERLFKLTLPQLKQLMQFANDNNGSTVVDAEVKKETAVNPPA